MKKIKDFGYWILDYASRRLRLPENFGLISRRDSSLGPSARASLRMTGNSVPMCLCAFVPIFLILEFGLWTALTAQSLPGVWESHGPYTHAQTTAFFVDADEESRIYVATEEQGIFISETGGSSWAKLPAPLDNAVIKCFHKIDQTLFAVSTGKLYQSDDGFFWQEAVAPAGRSAGMTIAHNKSFLTEYNGLIYAGSLWGKGIYTSSDGGINWESINSPLDEQIVTAFLRVNDTLFASTFENGVYNSIDGTTWTHSSTGIEKKSIEHLLQIDNIIFAGGSDGLYLSADGKTWNSSVPPLDTLSVTLLEYQSGIVYAASAESNTGLYTSDDLGSSWTQTLTNEAINTVLYVNSHLYAGTESGLFHSTAGETNWQFVQLQPDPGKITSLAMNTTDIFAISRSGIFKSAIDQPKWFPTQHIQAIANLHGLIVDQSVILAYGSRVYRSIDNGYTWETAYPPVSWKRVDIIKILETEDGFIAAAGGIFHSFDGIIWEHINSELDSLSVTTLVSAGSIFYTGTAMNGIFYSSDAGINWTQANPPLDNKQVHIIYPYQNRVYAGTQNGLYVSDDGGINWQSASTELINITVTTFCNSNGTLLLGTQGQGIYFSTDNGNSWSQSDPPMSDTFVDKLFAHNSFIFAELRDNPIYFSHNMGLSWSSADSIFENQTLIDFSHVDSTLFISTWNKKTLKARIHRSIDNGESWTALSKDLNDTSILLAPLYLPALNRLYTCGDGVSYQIFDLEAPQIAQFAPVDTSRFIRNTAIEISITAPGADSMIISEQSNFQDAEWLEHQQIVDFTLTPSQGLKTIYTRVKDFSGNLSDTISTQVNLDNLAPIFTGTFMLTPSFADTCVENIDLRWRYNFEELDHAIAGQNWYLGPQCKDFPDHEIQVGIKAWPGGTSINSGFTGISREPQCDPVSTGFDWFIWHSNRIYRLEIPASLVGNKGLDVQLLATDVAGNTGTYIAQKYQDQPLSYFSLPVRLNGQYLGESDILPGGTDASAFRIISVPFKLPTNQLIFRAQHLGNFSNYGPKGDWMFWSYDGAGLWTNGNDIEINDGSGYFLLLRDSKPLKPIPPTTTSVITTMKTTAGVWGEIEGWQLRAGDWTLIGNPYRTRIELDQLKLENRDIRLDQASTEFSIYGYTRSGWTSDDIALEPWGGLVIFLADSADVIVFANPADPYSRPPDKVSQPLAGQLNELNEGDWLVQIRAETEGPADNTNFFGVRSDAMEDHDKFDWFEPPQVPGGISVSFPHPEWKVATTYAADIRAPADDGFTWPIQITAEGGSAVTLNFEHLGEFPVQFQMWLVDETTSLIRDLRKQQQIQIRIPEETRTKNYQIIVGTESYIAKHTDGFATVPDDFALYQNYPNPFNPVTVIRYALPVEGRVTLQIYDVLGQEVQTVSNNTHHDVGYYEQLVDMAIFSSGVYFYQLKVDGETQFVDVKKMILLK